MSSRLNLRLGRKRAQQKVDAMKRKREALMAEIEWMKAQAWVDAHLPNLNRT